MRHPMSHVSHQHHDDVALVSWQAVTAHTIWEEYLHTIRGHREICPMISVRASQTIWHTCYRTTSTDSQTSKKG